MKNTIIFLTSFFLLFTSLIFSLDGSLDTSFDTDGKVTTDINLDNDNGNGIAIQSDGKIVVVGYILKTKWFSDFNNCHIEGVFFTTEISQWLIS